MINECTCTELDNRVFKCHDCGMCTLCNNEYYMVDNGLWDTATEDFGGHGMLCIGCLEARIGDRLQADDFPDLPINRGFFPISARFANRLGIA
jgi:hypothetical protein